MSIDKKTGHWIYSDYSGIKKIDEHDKKLQLKINQEVDGVMPFHYLSVIKMNSTFLELCNRPYAFYGLLLVIYIIIFTLFSIILPIISFNDIYRISVESGYFDFVTIVFALVFLSILPIVCIKYGFPVVKQKEINSFYYLPIRLNRKNKKVYIYQDTGEIKVLDWNKLFFYIASVDKLYGRKEYELRAAMVSENDDIEFSFSLNGPTTHHSEIRFCVDYWEFLRQYMQDGPHKFYINKDSLDQYKEYHLNYCNDIDGKLESYETSKKRVIDNYRFHLGEMFSVGPIFYPWIWVRRYLIKYQARIPYWPAEVEQECQIEEHDPYIVDASINQYFEIKTFPAHMRVKKKYLSN